MEDEKSRNIFEVALDAIDKVKDKVDDVVFDVKYDIKEKVHELRQQADDIINEKVEEGKIDKGAIGIATGAAKIGYGVVRGGFAVLGVFGHGLAGYFTRHHNPVAARNLVEHGFDAAKKHIDEGLEIFKDALDERKKK